MSLESCVYEGWVTHRRWQPIEHSFRYRHFMLYLDLDELPEALDGHRLWSARRPALAWFRREDYHGDASVPLAGAVRETVAERIGHRPAGPVRLLTNVRSFGHCFNPVSFYYCFDAPGDRRPRAIMAEVTNTPWGECHAYVMDCPHQDGEVMAQGFDKALHVSPFMGMDHRYEWRLAAPGPRLTVEIASHRGGAKAFEATLHMNRHELSGAVLNRMLLRYPATTLRVQARIYAQALRLKLKRAPYFSHPGQAAAR